MKRFTKLLTLCVSFSCLIYLSSCEEDTPNIPTGGDGLLVADGFYFSLEGADPQSSARLIASTVDGPDFSAMEREGFLQGYMYLTAGSYNLVEVADKEVVASYGGTLTEVTEVHNTECENSGYSLVAAALDGAAFSVATDGLYVVAYDETLGEIVYDQIESASIIGGGTPGGWSNDTPMTGTVTAEGGTWTVTGVTLSVGQMKFRFNCRWAIDRRLDTTLPFANDNGYSLFTNFGNAVNNLLPGNEGANIEITEYAVYTAEFSWSPTDGVSATLTKTGEAEPLPEYPTELYMIGNALNMDDSDSDGTPDGWQWALTNVKMVPVHSNPHLFWRITWLEAGGELKFSPVADWNGDFGKTGDATNGVYSRGGDNVPAPATSGFYMVVVNLESGAETIEIADPLVYGIGDAFGSWDADVQDYLFTVDNSDSETGSIHFDGFAADGNLRMYVRASTFTPVGDGPAVEWWQAEFNVFNGMIEYRATGNDQAAVPVTSGGSVSLNFKSETGTVQ